MDLDIESMRDRLGELEMTIILLQSMLKKQASEISELKKGKDNESESGSDNQP